MSLVLLVEDNHDIAAMLCDHLEHEGHEVDYAADGVTGLHLAVTGNFDAIILDLMLPGMPGCLSQISPGSGWGHTHPDADGARYA